MSQYEYVCTGPLPNDDDHHQLLDLLLLTSSLPLLTDLSLGHYTLGNIESLKNLAQLSSLQFEECQRFDLSFLTEEKSLPELTTLCINTCLWDSESSSSFACLSHAPNLRVLKLTSSLFNDLGIGSCDFDNDCLQYLENMVHLRTLYLCGTDVVGDSRSLKNLMQNLFQLEELYLADCNIGNQSAIAGALYSTHSRLRVLNLCNCDLVDDDLNGIGALKNTLEVLDLTHNRKLTNESLVHCQDLHKLKDLNLCGSSGIDDLSPLKDCLNLEDLFVFGCQRLTGASFKVFSEVPYSFPNLRVLSVFHDKQFTANVVAHLSKNNHLVYRLKELNFWVMKGILDSSTSFRRNICQLKGLRRIGGVIVDTWHSPSNEEIEVKTELMRSLKNLEEIP